MVAEKWDWISLVNAWRTLLNAWRTRRGRNCIRLVDLNTQHTGSYERAAAVQKDHHLAAWLDNPQLHRAFAVDGPVKAGGDGIEAVFGMPGNADRSSAQAFDAIVATFGLHIDP